MDISITIPEDIVRKIESSWPDLPQRAREVVAVDAYRSGIITEAEVQRMLDLATRLEVDALLKRHDVYLEYTEEDLIQDREAIRRARGR